MGTNFYWLKDEHECNTCKRKYEPIHIGKSSAGWCFSLHIIPELGITNLDDWVNMFNTAGSIIVDEYDRKLSVNDMLYRIHNRGLNPERHTHEDCVAQGIGPYDYLIGEFS
tara:strand:- start:1453 stop:1785 length:333 start_codon:yes stop_codon:yes gene_type:complete